MIKPSLYGPNAGAPNYIHVGEDLSAKGKGQIMRFTRRRVFASICCVQEVLGGASSGAQSGHWGYQWPSC